MNVNLKTSVGDKFRNTSLGLLRIKKNLGINHFTDSETEKYLRKIILSTPLQNIEAKGKNHYFKCFEYNTILTVNSDSFTIITAKQIEKRINKSLITDCIGQRIHHIPSCSHSSIMEGVK